MYVDTYHTNVSKWLIFLCNNMSDESKSLKNSEINLYVAHYQIGITLYFLTTCVADTRMVGSKIMFKTNCGTFRPLYVLFGIHIFRYTVWNAISYKTLHKAPCNGASLQVKCTRNFKEEKGTAFHQDIAEPCQLTTQRAALSAQRPRSAAAVTPPPPPTLRGALFVCTRLNTLRIT